MLRIAQLTLDVQDIEVMTAFWSAADPQAEVERLLALGARHADVGQRGDEPYVVLADPEGNEFCVLTDWRDPALADR